MTTELLKTELFHKHIELNAKMLPFAGFNMPIQYSEGIKSEIEAVRNTAGIFDVSHMGEFFVEGPESNKFIDYMISNNYLKSPIGKAVYSPLCRENGTVIDDLIAYKLSENNSLICVNASNIDKDWNWFYKHAEKFDISLTNKSEEYSLIALQGPNAENILKMLEFDSKVLSLEYYGAIESSFRSQSLIVARTGYTGEDGFELFCKNEFINQMWGLLIDSGAKPCGLGARDVLRVEVCYPLYGHELNDELTPLDAALKWTVKTDKNFIGRDALHEVSSNYRLVKLSLDKGIPREGYKILDSDKNEIGLISSGTMSPTINQGIGIGRVKRDLWPKDLKFNIQVRKNIISANYIKGAFVTGGHK